MMVGVLGAFILAAVIVIVLPVSYMLSGTVFAALLGWALKDHAEATHEGSELIVTNY
jgi:hypothetical protein